MRGDATDIRPRPEPDDVSRFFWDAAGEGRLMLQRCGRCTRFQYPPDVACVHCQGTTLVPTEVSGRGSVWSFTVVERLFHAGFAASLPYVVALVELEEQGGLRLLTNIVDVAPDRVVIGMPVEATFEDRGEVSVPQFRPVGEPA
jgi:uncharacterized OB-fold protein